MTKENIEVTGLGMEDNQSLARLLFLSSAKPLGKDGSDDDRLQRQEAWKAEKSKYMAQARRMVRILEDDQFDIALDFKKPAV